MMQRRAFLLGASALLAPLRDSVLVHEHVLVDFGGWRVATPSRYDRQEVIRAALPKLQELKSLGCRRLQECTPNFLGRDAALLARLQELSGIELWTNTGIYGAADRKGVPGFAYQETAAQLAGRWIEEWKRGIDGVKPRFIKTAVNVFPLEPIDVKLVEAACTASLETGLVICSHTNGGGPAALAQLEIADRMRVAPSKFVWVHAQNEKDHAFHRKAAQAGAWVEFDGINPRTASWHLDCVQFMQEARLLNRTMISQDSGWYRVGEPGGGRYNGYTFIYTDFLPKLTAAQGRELLIDNPRACFGS